MKWTIREKNKRSTAREENEQGEELGFEMFFITILPENFLRSFVKGFMLHLDRSMFSKHTSRLMWNYSCAVIQALDWWDDLAFFPSRLAENKSLSKGKCIKRSCCSEVSSLQPAWAFLSTAQTRAPLPALPGARTGCSSAFCVWCWGVKFSILLEDCFYLLLSEGLLLLKRFNQAINLCIIGFFFKKKTCIVKTLLLFSLTSLQWDYLFPLVSYS